MPAKEIKDRRIQRTEQLLHQALGYVASTFILTLTWWVESRSPLPSNEINDLFRSLIVPSLAAILD